MTPRNGATDGGRISAELSGPSSDGPSRIPATTSPITGGWPSAHQQARQQVAGDEDRNVARRSTCSSTAAAI